MPRAGETIRRVATLLRFFGRRGFLTSAEWVPHTPEVLQMPNAVFGSKFPSQNSDEVVYFLVNRNGADPEMPPEPVTMPQLQPEKAATAGMRWYDCWRGVELHPSAGVLSFGI